MSRISHLTDKQWASIPKFSKEWVESVMSPVDDDVIRHNAHRMYELLDIKNSTIIILDNPIFIALSIVQLDSQLSSQLNSQLSSQLYSQLSSQLYSQLSSQLNSQLHSQLYSQLISQLNSQLHSQLRSQLNSQLSSQLSSQLHSQLRSQLSSQLSSQLNSQLSSQLSSQLHSQLNSQLSSQLRSQLNSQLSSQLHSQLRSQLSSQLNSQLDSWYIPVGWASNFGYYRFIQQIKKDFHNDRIEACGEFVNHVHVVFPFKNIMFCSRKPTTRWENGLLHSENKPAIEFRGGWNIWCLHGVKVSKEIVETPAGQLNPELIIKEQNAEVRREIVRKIGIDRVYQKLGGETIDTQGDYELILLKLEDRKRPYLKMKNPSIGVYHLEGVPVEIKQ